jgi:hypothetical protein
MLHFILAVNKQILRSSHFKNRHKKTGKSITGFKTIRSIKSILIEPILPLVFSFCLI